VDYSPDLHKRYTFWSGTIGGMFLALSYFGTDQSQVQRYISGTSLRESRLGLLFNSICKIPMQFSILLLGVLVFVFFQFQRPPLVFNQAAWKQVTGDKRALEAEFSTAQDHQRQFIEQWIDARHAGDRHAESQARIQALAAQKIGDDARQKALAMTGKITHASDTDYVFITFVLHFLPHGVIGLLIAAFLCAALSSKAAELNALSSSTTIDVYRNIIKPAADDRHYFLASRWFTVLWGFIAIAFALFIHFPDNLIQSVNIIGSLFYGVMLGLFLAGFFIPWIGGSAMFCSAFAAQAIVVWLYFRYVDVDKNPVSYLWLIPIGSCACVLGGLCLQPLIGKKARAVS
jgi:Na+/proline symporter